MVKKLMKHELYALFRMLFWLLCAVLLLSVLTRILYAVVGNDESEVSIALIFVTLIYQGSVLVLCFAAVLCSLSRYYRSLFTGEGYLTFSLPATATQLILAKFFSAAIATVACALVAFLSQLIAFPPSESWVFQSMPQFFAGISDAFVYEPLLAMEVTLLVLVLLPSDFFYLYLVASIGQLFTKGRTVITFVLFFGLSFVLSSVFSALIPAFEVANPHALLWGLIIPVAAFDVGSFFVIRYILTHKVNLVVG